MNTYAVQQYFEMKPYREECFETADGVLHDTKTIAQKWIEHRANKTITTHKNPAMVETPETETEQ